MADTMLILCEIIIRRRFPRLWLGRLMHHIVQTGSNLTSIFKVDQYDESLALRSGLCIAYFAELSTVFMRFRNIARWSGRKSMLKAAQWSLICSFAICRLANFGILIRCWFKCRPGVSPQIFRAMLSIQTCGYVMNAAWFVQLVKGAASSS